MNAISIEQKISDINRRYTRSTELQEWLECSDFILAMNCISMAFACNLQSLRHFMVKFSHNMIIAASRNEKIATFLPMTATWFSWQAQDTASDWADSMRREIVAPSIKLQRACLAEKREVLRYMKIITTPVAAAFLGITEKMINTVKARSEGQFGTTYAGGYCYSLEELNMIAQNLDWACDWVYTKEPAHADVDSTVLDYVIQVDEATAMAITDTTAAELQGLLTQTEHTRRQYRLADLEKVRIAKLHSVA